MTNSVNDKRITSYDLLRIISALAVILMHVTTGNLYAAEIGSGPWMAAAIVNCTAHFGVPVFVMISGALFLDPAKEINTKRLWLHTILRLAIVLLVWNCIYGITDYLDYSASLKYLVWEIVDGRQHLWFIPMIIGLYAVTPLLLRWIKNAPEYEIRYIIGLFFAVCIVWETVMAISPFDIVTFADKYRNIPLVCGYAGYYILGYYLVNVEITEQTRKVLIALGAVGLTLGEMSFIALSGITGTVKASVVDSYSVFTFFYAVGVFVLVSGVPGKAYKARVEKVITELGQDTLGVYLCHLMIIERVGVLRDRCMALPDALGYVVYAIVVFAIGAVLSAVVRRIPKVGRYVV